MDLEGNSFSGSIPLEWDVLSNLKALSVSHCTGLVGTIPHFLAELNGLETLKLQGTSLEGSIPDFLSELTNLSKFDHCFCRCAPLKCLIFCLSRSSMHLFCAIRGIISSWYEIDWNYARRNL